MAKRKKMVTKIILCFFVFFSLVFLFIFYLQIILEGMVGMVVAECKGFMEFNGICSFILIYSDRTMSMNIVVCFVFFVGIVDNVRVFFCLELLLIALKKKKKSYHFHAGNNLYFALVLSQSYVLTPTIKFIVFTSLNIYM